MRNFSNNVQEVLAQDIVEYFLLIDLLLGTTYRLTTHSSDIEFSDKIVYKANGAIFHYDSPRQNSILDRSAYTIQLIDPSNALFNEFKNGAVSKDVKIRAGFIHPTLGPLTSDSDLVYVYTGYVDAPRIQTDFESKIVELDCSSPMADFDMVRPFYTTAYGMDQYSTTDTSFDRINEGYELQVNWGKI